MAEMNIPWQVDAPQTVDHSDLKEVADYFDKQAGILQQGGWTEHAANLRKWASELREKPLKHYGI
jgi:hypothetical protein